MKILSLSIVIWSVIIYGIYIPAPENTPSKLPVSIVQTVFSGLVTSGFRLAYDFNLPAIGFGILKLKTPTKVISGIKHSVIDRELASGTYKIHIFEPPVRGNGAIIAIHGGGWVLADVPTSYKLYSKMALETNSIVFAPDYRTAPEFRFPQAHVDCVDTIVYAFENAVKYNFDENKILVTGDSAGGGLTLSSALEVSHRVFYLDQTLYQKVPLKAIVPVYPVGQGVYFNTDSYLNYNKYLLTRYQMAAFYSTYMSGDDSHIEKLLSNEYEYCSQEVLNHFKLLNLKLNSKTDFDENERRNSDFCEWRLSPVLSSDDLLKLLPPVVTYVAEHDVLKDDGVLLHKRLRIYGGKSELIQWDGGIHAQVALSAQFSPLPDGYNPVPEATIQVQEYFKKMKSLL